jgi:hypothetical protein
LHFESQYELLSPLLTVHPKWQLLSQLLLLYLSRYRNNDTLFHTSTKVLGPQNPESFVALRIHNIIAYQHFGDHLANRHELKYQILLLLVTYGLDLFNWYNFHLFEDNGFPKK